MGEAVIISIHSIQKAGVAQLVEQLICNQWVGGSIPLAGSIFFCNSSNFRLDYI